MLVSRKTQVLRSVSGAPVANRERGAGSYRAGLLLGMKGSISKFELSVIRPRMLDAKHGQAQRGELISVPIAYIWHREIGLGF